MVLAKKHTCISYNKQGTGKSCPLFVGGAPGTNVMFSNYRDIIKNLFENVFIWYNLFNIPKRLVMEMILVITGPSGSGKSTLRKILTEQFGINRLMNVTTREKRPGEVDGVDYVFMTRVEFERMKSRGRLLEWVEYSGNLYGLMRSSNMDGVTVLEAEGAMRLKGMFPQEVKIVYLQVPEETRRERMLHRGDSIVEIGKRLKTDRVNFENSGIKEKADLVVKNIDLSKAVDEILSLVKSGK